jgi:CRISPR-associated protein Cas1
MLDVASGEMNGEREPRNDYWRSETQKTKPRGRRERRAEPLILCGHAVALRVDSGALVIREGRTHYPQEPQTWRFFKGDLALPPRIVLLGGSGSISFDVLDWLSAHDVGLIRLSADGEVMSAITGHSFAADRDKVAWQEATRADLTRRLAFSTGLIRGKLKNSLVTLEAGLAPSKVRDTAIMKANVALTKLASDRPKDLTALRLVEATCASAYFAAWRSLQIRWIGTGRKPIPDDWRVFTSRASLANNGKLLNVNASHPVNAMLNLSYAILEANLRIKAVADGYDPTIGIMHHGRRGKSALVFDFVEPERPNVDASILGFLADHPLSAADFVVRSDGVVRLAPQFAAKLCGHASAVQGEIAKPPTSSCVASHIFLGDRLSG